MIYNLLLTLLIIDALVLILAILLQSGKGGGMAEALGGASSSDALFGTRQAGNLLTKASWWCGGIFIGLAFILEISASRGRVPTSILDKSFAPAKSAPTAPPTQQVPTTTSPSLPGAAPAPSAPSTALPNAPAKPDSGTKAPAPAASKKP